MTKNYLPPLNSLRAFEVAARHSSFKNAALELNVTQGAVSQQVAQLEAILQVPLFLRLNRQIVLTDAGRRLMADLTPVFDRISIAVAAIGRNRQASTLSVNVGPTIALRWLIPRLKDFSDRHPEIEILLTTSLLPFDFSDGAIDIAIRRKGGDRAGVVQRPFLSGAMRAVCSPDLLRERPIARIEDIEQHALLQVLSTGSLWPEWAHQMGYKGALNVRSQVYDELMFAIAAATHGQGIALCPVELVREELASGRLVLPFDGVIQENHWFRAFYTKDQIKADLIEVFVGWLEEQGAALPPFSP